jgi:hypothetical protein
MVVLCEFGVFAVWGRIPVPDLERRVTAPFISMWKSEIEEFGRWLCLYQDPE